MSIAEAPSSRSVWVAVAYGALDVRNHPTFLADAEVLVLPTIASPPLALTGEGATLWRKLVGTEVSDTDLTETQREIVHEMHTVGLVSNDPSHPGRVFDLSTPWLSSPMHELVYALVSHVARAHGIQIVFVKGPVLHSQGLRDREHSGDVDVWVDPLRIDDLVGAMYPWGWQQQADLWLGLPINHSLTLEPIDGWGCEIDVHRRMPGIALSDEAAFEVLLGATDSMKFAAVPALVPQRNINAVLSALHHMRPVIGIGTTEIAREQAVRALAATKKSVLTACKALDATEALRPALVEVVEPGTPLPSGRKPRDWQWRSQPNKAAAYWLQLGEIPWKKRPAVVARLVWPAPDVAETSARRAGEEHPPLITARLRRLKRGLVGIGRTITSAARRPWNKKVSRDDSTIEKSLRKG